MNTNLVTTQLQDQLVLADQRIPEQFAKCTGSTGGNSKRLPMPICKKVFLYKNGLTNIVDVQQAQYALNRAEADLNVAYINVWQSLLLKAASSGDFDLFVKQVK